VSAVLETFKHRANYVLFWCNMNDIITVAVVNGSNLHTGNILRFIYGVQKRSNNVMDIVKFHEFIVRHILL